MIPWQAVHRVCSLAETFANFIAAAGGNERQEHEWLRVGVIKGASRLLALVPANSHVQQELGGLLQALAEVQGGGQAGAVQLAAARLRAAVPSEEGHVQWSLPKGVHHWAEAFHVSDRTMGKWLREGRIPNKKLSRQSYQIDLAALPAPQQSRRRC
jgi:hypothetical protein